VKFWNQQIEGRSARSHKLQRWRYTESALNSTILMTTWT